MELPTGSVCARSEQTLGRQISRVWLAQDSHGLEISCALLLSSRRELCCWYRDFGSSRGNGGIRRVSEERRGSDSGNSGASFISLVRFLRLMNGNEWTSLIASVVECF